jgi:hypothetical protein
MSTTRDLEITNWKNIFNQLQQLQAEITRRGQWPLTGPFDLLTIGRVERKETVHTAIIAWLLNPTASHGLGFGFLNHLLNKLDLPDCIDHPSEIKVVTEDFRQSRRADIVVYCPNQTLLIEAKIDASESENQCDDLFHLWSKEPGATFLFLTPTGRRPRSATGAALEAFRPLSFRDIRDILQKQLQSLSHVRSPDLHDGSEHQYSATSAVHTYAQTLTTLFPRTGSTPMDESLRFYLEHEDTIKTWSELRNRIPRVTHAFFCSLQEPIESLAPQLGSDVESYINLESSYPKIGLRRRSWPTKKSRPQIFVGLEWRRDSASIKESYTGVWVDQSEELSHDEKIAARSLSDAVVKHAASHPIIKSIHLKTSAHSSMNLNPWWPIRSFEMPTNEMTPWWDHLHRFRDHLAERLRQQWELLAPLVDEVLAETINNNSEGHRDRTSAGITADRPTQ